MLGTGDLLCLNCEGIGGNNHTRNQVCQWTVRKLNQLLCTTRLPAFCIVMEMWDIIGLNKTCESILN